jgi:PTH2 family peptidyl-tRNA hydrolase
MKQVIVVRTDLKMGKGKLAAQVAHASLAAFLKTSYSKRKKWLEEGAKKVVLKVSSEEELLKLYRKAKKEKLPCEIIADRGLTQLKPGTFTALAIGPEKDERVDKITGDLKLL